MPQLPKKMANQAKKITYDVVVIGGGPVGLTLVSKLAAQHTQHSFQIALIDIRIIGEKYLDPRVLALSEGSRQILMPFAWPEKINPIQSIKVSSANQLGQTILSHKNTVLPSLGYATTYGALLAVLDAHLISISQSYNDCQNSENHSAFNHDQVNFSSNKVVIFNAMRALSYSVQEETVVVHCQNQDGQAINLKTKLLVNAEGSIAITSDTIQTQRTAGLSPTISNAYLTKAADEKIIIKDYQQSALISRVKVSKPAQGEAYERFTKLGAIALLPIGNLNLPCDKTSSYPVLFNNHSAFSPHLNDADYALIWCNPAMVNQQRLGMRNALFLNELQNEFGSSLGQFTNMGEMKIFDLRLVVKPIRAENRVVRIGNAAQTLHPIAGQGLNLGLRDAELLSRAIAQDGASCVALDRYVAARQTDRQQLINITDFLANGFNFYGVNLSAFKGLAFSIIDHFPFLKSHFARQMIFGLRD